MNESDWRLYREGMARYYDARYPKLAVDELVPHIESQHQKDHWIYPLVEDLRRAMTGRNVLELACGFGYWTWHLAQVSAFVHATDVSPALLDRVRQIVKGPNVALSLLDAQDVESLAGDFDAAFHFNLINHFPRENAREIVRSVHQRLGSGGLAFMGGEHYYGWRKRMYQKEGTPDFFSLRDDAPVPFELVDNPFEPHDIRELVGPAVSDLHIGNTYGGWWTRYRIE